MDKSPAWHRIFYWLMTRAMRLVVWTFGRYQVVGAERVPRHGPLVIVSNHLNNADPPLLGAAIPRPIRFMAKQELFDSRAGIFIRWFGAFPVRRFEADLAALRQAQEILKGGGALGMFPEGHRSRTGGMGPPHPGTALIALRSGATILPVAITGTERVRTPLVLLRKPRIRVVIGEPFRLDLAVLSRPQPPTSGTLLPIPPTSRPARVSSAAVAAGTDEIMRPSPPCCPPPIAACTRTVLEPPRRPSAPTAAKGRDQAGNIQRQPNVLAARGAPGVRGG